MKNAFDYLNDTKMDFDKYEEEAVSEKEILSMKKKITKKNVSTKKVFAAAVCAAVIAVTGTALASGYVSNIIKSVTTGHNVFMQIDPEAPYELPSELVGLIFDENGNEVKYMTENIGDFYDKDGNVLNAEIWANLIEEAYGGEVVYSNEDYDPEASEVTFASIDEAQETAVFDLKVPSYLPEGYSLKRVYAFKNNDGSVSGEYVNFVYANGEKEIHIFERIMNEETAFETGTSGELKEITINGRNAVIMDGSDINWETEDDVSVGIYGGRNITEEELIKMAESVE